MKAVLVGLATLGSIACNHSEAPRPTRYILDSGFSGWVKIIYNRSDAPELPVEDGFTVVHIQTPNMIVRARNPMNSTWDRSEFYYQGRDGKRSQLSSKDDAQRRLWALEKTSDKQGDQETFFVGKDTDFVHTSADITQITPASDLAGPAAKAPGSPESPISQEDLLKGLTSLSK